MKKIIFGVAIAISALAMSACGGGGGGMSAKMPVEEAKTLHQFVKTDYDTIIGNWTAAQENAGTIGQVTGVDVAALTDVDQFKAALVECYNTPVKRMQAEGGATGDAAKTAMVGYEELEGCSTDKVEALASTGDASIDGFYKSKLEQVDRMRMDLLYVVPNNAQALVEKAPSIIEEVATLRANAEAALAAAENNPLASGDQKAKAKADYDATIAELDAIQALAEQLGNDLASVPADAAALGESVASDLSEFPKQGDTGGDDMGDGEDMGDDGDS